MGVHPYPFKWRIFQRFSALLVMTLSNIRKARELDREIAEFASDIRKLKNELDSVRNKLKGEDVKAKSLQKRIDRKIGKIEGKVGSFCKSLREELKDFMKIKIDSDTLHYRESKYLRHLAKMMIRSKSIDNKHIEALKKGIEGEMESLERKAGALELQAKHLERGGVNTVVFSHISPWGNRWIERMMGVETIEVNALHKRLKSDSQEDLFKDFEREVVDIYKIGNNVNILMKRLKATFNSMKTKMREMGLSVHDLDKTERFFNVSFKRMERISRWLNNELKGQGSKLTRYVRSIKAPKQSRRHAA